MLISSLKTYYVRFIVIPYVWTGIKLSFPTTYMILIRFKPEPMKHMPSTVVKWLFFIQNHYFRSQISWYTYWICFKNPDNNKNGRINRWISVFALPLSAVKHCYNYKRLSIADTREQKPNDQLQANINCQFLLLFQ